MIVASFDRTKSAAVCGAYQYDTGQRLVMHGLPSPEELAQMDELLSGELVTVQAQFSYEGDSQAQMRLAMWDAARGVWICEVPDEYLTRHREVHVYVYLYYGADSTGERAQTAYEATFRPISRPAPEGTVTGEQIEQWNDLKAEIDISMEKVQSAVNGVNAAAQEADGANKRADQAAQDALDAAKAAREARNDLAAAGGQATSGLTLRAEKGANGKKGEMGDTGPADVTLEFDSETGTLTIMTKGSEG